MCWGSSWYNLGIRKKIVLSNTIALLIGFIILHLSLIVFTPSVYVNYRKYVINKKIDKLIDKLETTKFNDLNEKLDDFTYDNDIMMTITDNDGKIVYTSFRDGYVIPSEYHLKSTRSDITRLNITKDFTFKQIDNKECNLNIHIPVRSEEIRTIIRVFLPFAIISTLMISMMTALFFSKVISKPLIQLTKKAEGIAKLDFSQNFYSYDKDEIGQLSNSLDIVKSNLSTTIEKLKRANDQLKSDLKKELLVDKERREFMAVISHELKSPITIISGQVQGMIHGIGRYKDRDKYLREVYEVTKVMENLVMEIINVSKNLCSGFEIDREYIDISEMLREVLRSNYYFSEKKKISVYEIIEDDVFVSGDRKLLRKALNNILKNAFEHSPRGGEVRVNLNSNGLSVKNTSVEIPKEDMEKVFHAFYRVDKSRNNRTGGSGLGLYIVYLILEKHDSIKYNLEYSDGYVVFNMEFI
ncbi:MULTISPECIES: ATP-binding protein [Clostridium]|uniref:histidine kinase n=1 Tax=Clostridium cibarium TaxID=2762247 RepID=A0ABR8PU88_9CLOT|nr:MULTISPECIES: ATP-binding protein [Clostridium]MBD7911693.1 HAMP domain-containing protein [Clostridium cibarium]